MKARPPQVSLRTRQSAPGWLTRLACWLPLLWLIACTGRLGAAEQVTVHFDTGTQFLYSDSLLGTKLSAGSSAVGDGCVVELGYYSSASVGAPFAGDWVALSGESSANSAFKNTSIGDEPSQGANAGTFALSLTFISGSGSKGQNLPAAGTPLAIRFYNATSVGTATVFNVVTCASWLWQPPQSGPSQPVLTLSLDDSNLVWIGGPSTAFYTSQMGSSGSVEFSAASYEFSSANGSNAPNELLIPLLRTGGLAGSGTVTASITGGTLTGTDYTFSDSVITFDEGVANGTIHIPLTGIQLSGSIVLTLSSPSGVALGSQTTATLNVTAAGVINPGAISFSSATYRKVKSSGATAVSITARRTGGTSGAVSAQVTVTGGSATPTTDFTLPTTILSWGAGDAADKSFDLTIAAGAQLASAGDTVELALTNFTGSAIAGTQATTIVTLLASDVLIPTVTLTSPSANAKITSSSVTFSGSATDNKLVSKVKVVLNGNTYYATLLNSGPVVDWTLDLVPEQGTNTVEVTAYDPQDNASAKVIRSFTFAYLRPTLAGSYNGLLVADAGAASPEEKNGLLGLRVTATGNFTGKIHLGGVSITLAGLFKSNGDAEFGKLHTPQLQLTKGEGVTKATLGYLTLKLNESGFASVVGSLTDEPKAVTYASGVADKAIYSAAAVLPATMQHVPLQILDSTREKGHYTGIFTSVVDPGFSTNNGLAKSAFPQGTGYGVIKVYPSGLVKVIGRLADGSIVSYKNRLSGYNQWPVFIPLYHNAGYLAGNVQFDSTQTESDAACPGMKWYRPSGLALYPAGWPNSITTDFLASKFIAKSVPTVKVPVPANPDTILGPGFVGVTTPTVNLRITLKDEGLGARLSNDASLSGTSKCTIIGATAGETGATGLSASFVGATGAFSGHFTHPVSRTQMNLQGVVFQKTTSASGYFIYVPATGSSPAAIRESGSIEMVGLVR